MEWKKKLSELRAQMRTNIEQARGMMNSEKAGLLDDKETGEIDRLMSEAEKIRNSDEFKRLLDLEKRAQKIDGFIAEDDDSDRRLTRAGTPGSANPGSNRFAQGGGNPGSNAGRGQATEEQHRSALDRAMRQGFGSLDEEQRSILGCGVAGAASMARGTQTTVGMADGAALVSPLMANSINEAITIFTSMADMGATVINTDSGANMSLPKVDYASKSAREVGEGVEDNAEDTLAFGANDIPTFETITDLFYISRSLLADASYDVVGTLTKAFASMFANLMAKRTVYGNGANQGLGLFWKLCADGHVVDTAASTTFADNDLTALMTATGVAYRESPASRFAFGSDFKYNYMLNLKDSTGRPLYQAPNNDLAEVIKGKKWSVLTALNDAVTLPTTPAAAVCSLGTTPVGSLTAGRILAAYGDASQFVIRNVKGVEIERFDQLETAVKRRSIAFRAVRRYGCGWNSASTSAATRPMALLRTKN